MVQFKMEAGYNQCGKSSMQESLLKTFLSLLGTENNFEHEHLQTSKHHLSTPIGTTYKLGSKELGSTRCRLFSQELSNQENIDDSTTDTSSVFTQESLYAVPFVPNNFAAEPKKDKTNFRLMKCQTYHQAPYHCPYGDGCQFAHLQRHFSKKHTSYR